MRLALRFGARIFNFEIQYLKNGRTGVSHTGDEFCELRESVTRLGTLGGNEICEDFAAHDLLSTAGYAAIFFHLLNDWPSPKPGLRRSWENIFCVFRVLGWLFGFFAKPTDGKRPSF